MSLLLPWEVIERVIEHASDDLDLLHSFSLSCRQLRPRSFNLIIAQYVFLNSRDRVSSFSDFLLERPELQPLIHSIFISPADFRPFPLVNMLPRLSTLFFTSPGYKEHHLSEHRPPIDMHHTTITCYHSFGKRIHTLSLNHLSFRTSGDFYRLILAFSTRMKLTLDDVLIRSREKETPGTTCVRNKLSKQLRLETLHVRS